MCLKLCARKGEAEGDFRVTGCNHNTKKQPQALDSNFEIHLAGLQRTPPAEEGQRFLDSLALHRLHIQKYDVVMLLMYVVMVMSREMLL